MQVMTWPLARLGSRFGFVFEPARRRVLHSALGRFLDEPLDLAVGLVEPDGTERVLPFTQHGKVFYACEQFERINSVTYRGFCQSTGLRFELNVHAPFYPQDERICTVPAFYLELRVTSVPRIRLKRYDTPPEKVRLFVRLSRPRTRVAAAPGLIELDYEVPLTPRYEASCGSNDCFGAPCADLPRSARVHECITSLNEGAEPMTDPHGGVGLTLELPVTEEGSGIKWRLVWAAHTADAPLEVHGQPAKFLYTDHWPDVAAVMKWAVENRDANLALSRRFEKILEQAPFTRAQWHLLVMAFHSFLSNSWWCRRADGREFFSVWEGNVMFHNTLDVGYNMSLFYLALWPRLLGLCLRQWAAMGVEHATSGGLVLQHDMGRGVVVTEKQAYHHPMPVEENCNFMLMLQAYAHWTGDTSLLKEQPDVLRRLAEYLVWCDVDGDGFPDEGTANTLDDGSQAVQFSRKQTYLAIKRVCALEAAAELLKRVGQAELADRCAKSAAASVKKIETDTWLDDHYSVCVDKYHNVDTHPTGETVLLDHMEGWDDYSIYTANALLLPSMIAHPLPLDRTRLRRDLLSSYRETLHHYGCTHTSSDSTNVWISQNLWRDFTSRYLHTELVELDARYWDLLIFSNTGDNSFGYADTHIGNELCFNPRGVTAFGLFLAGPRIVIDRLDTEYYSVNPDRTMPHRWPLLPLADWEAGKIPICVVHASGRVTLEGEIEPVKVIQPTEADPNTIG